MDRIGQRLRELREGIKLSQAKLAALAGTTQATINRYESGVSSTPLKMLIWYADYFDVSMDYLCGRTDKPQGKLYNYHPKILDENKDMKDFIDMCFDPKSPMNGKLKAKLVEMLGEVETNE